MRDMVFLKMQKFANENRFKQHVKVCIAEKFAKRRISLVQEAFRKVDKNKNGVLCFDEVKSVLVDQLGNEMKDEEMLETIKKMDVDGDGEIDYKEFLAATMQTKEYTNESRLRDIFDTFDADSSGRLEINEVRAALGSNKYSEEALRKYDIDGDGKMSFDEFLAMMREDEFSTQ